MKKKHVLAGRGYENQRKTCHLSSTGFSYKTKIEKLWMLVRTECSVGQCDEIRGHGGDEIVMPLTLGVTRNVAKCDSYRALLVSSVISASTL